MFVVLTLPFSADADWTRPPPCLVAGLVILRQPPGTVKGVIFLTLEDETGIVNVIVWRKLYEQFHRAVISGRMLRVAGRLQRAHSVPHVIAEQIKGILPMLDRLLQDPG